MNVHIKCILCEELLRMEAMHAAVAVTQHTFDKGTPHWEVFVHCMMTMERLILFSHVMETGVPFSKLSNYDAIVHL